MQAQLTAQQVTAIQASFMNKVYAWMCLALTLTAFVAFRTASSEAMMSIILNPLVHFGLMIILLGIVFWMSRSIATISSNTAIGYFLLFSALMGLSLSVIFLVYTQASITSTFFVTAGMFGVMSVYGYFTKRDLSSIGNILFMGLIGIILASIVNAFMRSETIYWIITYAGVVIFVGLTAYDTQKLRQLSLEINMESEMGRKGAIMGALTLYLDFINLFIFLIRILGERR